ncbi:RNA-binding domain-containing protein [Rasiella sp. SM2506]|uniref:RNA-binding domain-containing protein n=1 Tax=Rasiella sp. SM2506 TaxID=3423914 RepID=UPI003D79B400
MNTETLHTTLHFSSFFKILEDSEKRLLLAILKRKEFKKGDVVFSESQCAASIYILERGSVTLTIPGNYTIFVRRGDVFGEIAVINDTVRLGTALARSTCSILELNTEALYNDAIIPSKIALKITRVIAKKHSSLKLRRSDFSTLEIIQQGESDFVEFKSTLRFNLMSEKMDSNIELSALKTVAAFLNTSGGTLLIGVADDGTINGLSLDNFTNEDKLLLHFTNLLRDKIGEKTLGFVHFNIVHIQNEQILRVEVSKSNSPVFVLFQNNEYFYVRSGPSTLNLKFSEFYNYNLKHFT